MSTVHAEPPLEAIKTVRLLLEIALVIVTKTGYLCNRFVFTVNIDDNNDIVMLVNTFCTNIQSEQFASLLERYAKLPKAMHKNLGIYSILCHMLTTIVNHMVHTFKFPKDEISKCTIFQQTLPAFLNYMTEQINTFVVTRAIEISKYSDQHTLIYHFIVFFRTVMV
jgi:hypothetical protein